MTKGEKIRSLREQLHISQTELADRINVSKQTLYKYEHDIVTNIPSDKIEALADALRTTPSDIMGWDEPSETYYIDPETAQAAQEMFENKELRALFDASKDISAEDLRAVYNIVLALKRKERGNDDDDTGC